MKLIGEYLKERSYVGRGILVGLSESNRAMFAYFISGRSANSRNRTFVLNGDELKTQPYDESKVEDPSLIIYSPVKRVKNDVIVTNGDQTDTIEECLKQGKCFRHALKTRCFEPDEPNFTPRISAILHLEKEFTYELSILKCADGVGKKCNRFFYEYEALKGAGHFISTYQKDSPLPSFEGEPVLAAVPDDLKAFAYDIWNNLNEDNRISLYCKAISLDTGKQEDVLINKYQK